MWIESLVAFGSCNYGDEEFIGNSAPLFRFRANGTEINASVQQENNTQVSIVKHITEWNDILKSVSYIFNVSMNRNGTFFCSANRFPIFAA